MTIAINFAVPEGIVFAADSRQTFRNAKGDVRVSSDNGQKLMQVGPRAAAVTYGWAFLLGRSIQSHITDYKISLGDKVPSIEELAKGLGEYLTKQYNDHIEKQFDKPVPDGNYALALLVGGYDPGDKNGRVYEVFVPKGENYVVHSTVDKVGSGWRGQTTVIARLLKGYDVRIRELNGFAPDLDKALGESKLDYNVDYWSMPLQDAVDFATFLVHTTIQMQRFSDGIMLAPGDSANCGGPIDVAVIDPNDGFRWVQHKTLHIDSGGASLLQGET